MAGNGETFPLAVSLLQIDSYVPGVPRDSLFVFDGFAYTASP
jgi:hypothetical protein